MIQRSYEKKVLGKKEKKVSQQTDMDSFLKGIESSGPYNLDIFKGDEKGNKVARRGPAVKKSTSSGPYNLDIFKGDEKGNKVAKRGPAVKKSTSSGPYNLNIFTEEEKPVKRKGARKGARVTRKTEKKRVVVLF